MHRDEQVCLSWGTVGLPHLHPNPCNHPAGAQDAHLPAADAGVGAVPHATPGVAVVLKEAAQEGEASE